MQKKSLIAISLLGIALFGTSVIVNAASVKPDAIKSQGRIVFDNNTDDPADDVIFDAEDIYYLYHICE